MFSFTGGINDVLLHFSPYNCLFLAFAVVFAMPVVPALKKFVSKNEKRRVTGEAVSYILCVPLLILCIMSLASSTFNPFIYYHF
jgi:alginate O-acetyltransferase complex protein AlgI